MKAESPSVVAGRPEGVTFILFFQAEGGIRDIGVTGVQTCALPISVLLGIAISPFTAVAFVLGAITSAIAGNIGMRIATKANGRTAIAAKEGGLAKALDVAFSGGAVMGLSVVGLGILMLSIVMLVLTNVAGLELAEVASELTGFGMGASSIALFARVGGG